MANDSTIRTPSFEDYKGAVSAILRLQETYNIDAKTFADGLLAGIPVCIDLQHMLILNKIS